jgi:CRP-like cAMP-binding protein
VSSGRLRIVRDGKEVAEVTRGGSFGEVALIEDIPRQATVIAQSDSLLYALRKDLFVQTVTGHRKTALSAGRIIAGHLGDGTEPGFDGQTDDAD